MADSLSLADRVASGQPGQSANKPEKTENSARKSILLLTVIACDIRSPERVRALPEQLDTLDSHYNLVIEAIVDSRLVPFLDANVNLESCRSHASQPSNC
jgi:hypothetical protein